MWSIVNEEMSKLRGLSTDTKPAAANGSEFLEMDTGDTYYYDADSSAWVKPTPAT